MMATPLQGLTRSISAHRATANVKGLTHHANYLYAMNKRHSIGKVPLVQNDRDLDARLWRCADLHAHRSTARTREDEPQADRRPSPRRNDVPYMAANARRVLTS